MARVPILLYHHISHGPGSSMNVSPSVLERHLRHLKAGGWRSVSLASIIDGSVPPRRSVVLTFDDGYQDFADTAWPIIRRMGFSAVCFVVPNRVGGENVWDGGGEPLMSSETLGTLVGEGVELGLHGWNHEDWDAMAPEVMSDLLGRMTAWFGDQALPFVPAMAYPGGKFPRAKSQRDALGEVFTRHGIRGCLRIGSACARVPSRDPWAIRRVPVEGTDGPAALWCKLRFGRTRL